MASQTYTRFRDMNTVKGCLYDDIYTKNDMTQVEECPNRDIITYKERLQRKNDQSEIDAVDELLASHRHAQVLRMAGFTDTHAVEEWLTSQTCMTCYTDIHI